MTHPDFTPVFSPVEKKPERAKNNSVNYDDLQADHVNSERSEAKNQEALEHWQALISKVKNDTTDGFITKEFARIEADVLLRDLATIKQNWSGRASTEKLKELDRMITDLKTFRKSIASFMERARGLTAGVLVGLGMYGVIKGKEHIENFNEARNETASLSASEHRFLPPALPESVLALPEKASLPNTDDLFRQYEKFVQDNPQKGLDLSVEEKEPGLLGVYLKFGRQIDRSVKFSDKFLPEISRRTEIAQPDLVLAQDILHDSVYEQPPTMGGEGTSSVFYSSEHILKLAGHEKFYVNQLAAALELIKQKLPMIKSAPAEMQTDLTKALAEFIQTDLAVRAYDERIKDAIKNQREFELEGVDGTYEDAPSLFARQEKQIKAREKAISEWYEILAKIDMAAAEQHTASQLAVRLQGWADKRAAALAVSEQESEKGVILSDGVEEWNDFVKKGDEEFNTNIKALHALLNEDAQSDTRVAAK